MGNKLYFMRIMAKILNENDLKKRLNSFIRKIKYKDFAVMARYFLPPQNTTRSSVL